MTPGLRVYVGALGGLGFLLVVLLIWLMAARLRQRRLVAATGSTNLDATADAPRRQKMSTGKAVAIVFTGLVVIGAVLPDHHDGSTSSDHGSENGAVSACKPVILDKLTAPDTARFDEITVQSFGDGLFNVDGSVSSDNTFGALVQKGYHCELKYSGGQWTVSTAKVIIE